MTEFFSNINWWTVALVAVFCYIASTIKIVSEKEVGVWIFWGHILRVLKSGPHFVPWPTRFTKFSKNQIKVDFGTLDTADVERANQANASQSWFIFQEPIRINWGDIESSGLTDDERKQYEGDPFAKRLTTDPHMYFIFKIFNPIKLIEEAGGLNEAMDRIKDTCVTALSKVAGQTFVAKAIKEIDGISDKIRKDVEWLVGDPNAEERNGKKPDLEHSWGVDVLEVRIKDLGTPRRTNEAVADRSATVARAAGEATATELKAEAEKTKRTKEGEGAAAAIKAEGTATANAIKVRAKAVSTPGGELVIRYDTLGQAIKDGNVTILPMDQSILTGVASVKAVLDAVEKKGEK